MVLRQDRSQAMQEISTRPVAGGRSTLLYVAVAQLRNLFISSSEADFIINKIMSIVLSDVCLLYRSSRYRKPAQVNEQLDNRLLKPGWPVGDPKIPLFIYLNW